MIKETTIVTTGGESVCIEQTSDGVIFYKIFSGGLNLDDMKEVNTVIAMLEKHNEK